MTRLQNGPWTIRLAPGAEKDLVLATVKNFDRMESEGCANGSAGLWQIHAGGRSTIYGFRLFDTNACLKVFTDKRFLTGVRNFLGWSKGRRAYNNGLLAYNKGVPVPRVYAYAEKRPCGPTLVVMELLENAVQMNLLLEERLASGIDLTSDPVFQALTGHFARFTRDLHARGVCHRDFSPRNVLVADLCGQLRMQLIDLEDIDFNCSPRKFRSNIEHFHGKMTRYVNSAALKLFKNGFNEIYAKGLNQ